MSSATISRSRRLSCWRGAAAGVPASGGRLRLEARRGGRFAGWLVFTIAGPSKLFPSLGTVASGCPPSYLPIRSLKIVPLAFEISENPLFVTYRSPSGPKVIDAG